ncbi:MAG: alpha/beta fold hydrolase [Candidatus Saccharimonadales bacterium]
MQVVVDDLLTNCDLSGKGPLTLLLHGWGDNLQGLRLLHSELAKDHQVLSLDLPGFGKTDAPKTVWNLDNYAYFVANVIKKLELDEPEIVIGHSNGGALAIRAVSLNILEPKKLVLIAASGIRNNKTAKRMALQVLAKTGNAATIWMPERYREALRKSLYGAAGSDLLVMPQLEETFKKTVRQDVQKDAKLITIPTLLIYAKKDEAVPIAYGRRFHELIEGSKLEEIDDSGHFIHLDQSEKVLELIERFIKNNNA